MSGISTDLDLRLTRIFFAVVNAGGLSAAQHALNMRQPTISSHIADLEMRLGYRLCERGRKGFRLTPKGERFLHVARRYLNLLGELNIEARNIDRELVGILNLGLIGNAPAAQNALLSRAISQFRRRDEAVQINVTINSPDLIEDLLENGQLHAAIGYFWRRVPVLEYRHLFSERQVAYCGRGHALFADSGICTIEQLSGQSWASRRYPVPTAPQLPPNSRITASADNMEANLILVLSGKHLGYLPDHFAEPYCKAGDLAPLNPDMLSYGVDFHLALRRDYKADPVVSAFIEDLSAQVQRQA